MKTLPENESQVSEFTGDIRWELVQRINESPHFIGSARLRDFLTHITLCALRHNPEEASEQQIGIHVFHRNPGFNSSEDSIVRSHARLLRLKLAAFFRAEGASEPIIIEIPKGRYLPIFTPAPHLQPTVPQPELPSQTPLENPAETPQSVPAGRSRPRWRTYACISLIMLVILAVWGGVLWKQKRAAATPSPRSPLETLWYPFFTGNEPPLVIYSNAVFVGSARTGMHYASPDGSDNQSPLRIDSYTGIGELVAVHQLTKLFDQHNASFVLKRSPLVTWDEAKFRNLIFIGSTVENPSLRVLPAIRDFTITSTPSSSGFTNQHPLTGEPLIYQRSERPLTKDYAVVALLPGLQPGRRTLIFSGLTTLGTQAAVEYSSNPASVAEIMRYAAKGRSIHDFEALLEVNVNGGVPLQTRLVTIRVH